MEPDDRELIYRAIPHREPFLLVDRIVSCGADRITCTKRFSGQEEFFKGHYPQFPLVPGVLLCEAAVQSGAILLARLAEPSPGYIPVVTRLNNVRFKRMVRPGETADISVRLRERVGGAYYLDAEVAVDGAVAVRLEFACMMAPASEPDC